MKMMHVTVQTKCFDEERIFYEKIVGLKIQREMEAQGRKLVFLSNGEGETCIEIIGNPEAEDSGSAHLSVGFHTEDVEALREKLVTEGLSPTPMITPAPGVKFFFVKDPAGVTVQFI